MVPCCCILRGPGWERVVDVVPGGTGLELRLRRGVGHSAHARINPRVKCTGVYCAQTVNNADASEMYGVQFFVSWAPSLPLTLMVQLHTKFLVTFRETSADCNCTRQLLLHAPTNTLLAR